MSKQVTPLSNKKISTISLVQLSLFSTIIFILGLTPLGFIPIGAFQIVTVHIPVIIGSLILGPKKGAFLGFLFGLTSMITAHLTVSPISYFFSPLISQNIFSLVVCFVPRILVGIVPYYVFNLLKKVMNINTSIIISCIIASFTNTILVIGFILIFFYEKYSEVAGLTSTNLLATIIITSFSVNAILEAIIASVLPLSICRILFKLK